MGRDMSVVKADDVQSFKPDLFPVRCLGAPVPLGDPSIKIPTVVIDLLSPGMKIYQQLLHSGEIETFKVGQPDDNVRYLNAGVVDVILDVDPLSGSTQQPHEGIAQYGVAYVANVRRLIGVDAGVLDQGMEVALLLVKVTLGNLLRSRLAVELAVDITSTRHGEGSKTLQRQQFADQLGGNLTRRSLEAASQLERDRQRILAHLKIGRLLNRNLRKFYLIPGLKNGAKTLTE